MPGATLQRHLTPFRSRGAGRIPAAPPATAVPACARLHEAPLVFSPCGLAPFCLRGLQHASEEGYEVAPDVGRVVQEPGISFLESLQLSTELFRKVAPTMLQRRPPTKEPWETRVPPQSPQYPPSSAPSQGPAKPRLLHPLLHGPLRGGQAQFLGGISGRGSSNGRLKARPPFSGRP